jgi:hypothetical protein
MPEPFNTEKPITERGKATYKTIAARLAALDPPVFIEGHIAQTDKLIRKQDKILGKTQFSTLEANESTLDGINFRAVDPDLLVRELERAKDKWGSQALASMREDPGHWALKASFGKTVGTGWREKWREAPYGSPATTLEAEGKADNLMRMRFGTAGSSIRFTALHCAVHEIGGQCNIHIDETGFVLALPKGFALTPDLYGHFVNELLVKTDFRDWLAGKMPNETAARIVKEVFRRVSFIFPNAANGYAGLDKRIKGLRQPKGVTNGLLTAGKFLAPMGVTFDVYDSDRYKVQVTGTFDDPSITITIGGEW